MISGLATSAIAHLPDGTTRDYRSPLDEAFVALGEGHLTSLELGLQSVTPGGENQVTLCLVNIASEVTLVFTGSDGRRPQRFSPDNAGEAFVLFGRDSGTLHMIFTHDLESGEDQTLFIRHGGDGIQVFEDERLHSRVRPKPERTRWETSDPVGDLIAASRRSPA